MMFSKQDKLIKVESYPGVFITLNIMNYLNDLRVWKNRNKNFFYYKKNISMSEQRSWFQSYLDRPSDYMFVVLFNGDRVGCMGVRNIGLAWDVYNIILGEVHYGGRGIMSSAFQAMLRFCGEQNELPITLEVLKDNPAINWYRKNGFLPIYESADSVNMKYVVNSDGLLI